MVTKRVCVCVCVCVCARVCLACYARRLIAAFLYMYSVCICSFRGMSFIIIVIGLAFLGLRAFH